MDDDDAFLYGNDELQAEDSLETNLAVQGQQQQFSQQQPKQSTETDDVAMATGPNEESEDEEESEEEESDSDVEFIIGSLESKPAAIPESVAAAITAETNPEETQLSALVTNNLGETSLTIAEGVDALSTIDSNGQLKTVPRMTATPQTLDVDKIGMLKDVPITEVALEELKDKPWRLPGADVSDYFNYGFDEISWKAYVNKHERLRNEFSPSNMMGMSMMNSFLPSGMNMPGMMGMGGMSGMNMSGMSGMPGMSGLNMMAGTSGANNGGNSVNKQENKNESRDYRDQIDKDIEKGQGRRDDRRDDRWDGGRDGGRDRRDRDRRDWDDRDDRGDRNDRGDRRRRRRR